MKRWLYASLFALATSANAYDTKNGQSLFEEANCLQCHTAEKMVSGGKASDYPKLRGWVSSCANNLGIDWFPEDIDDVTAYMAKDIYQYPIPE